jgi:hypothetical protein
MLTPEQMLANRRYKPPDPGALPQALQVVAHAKEVSHPDNEEGVSTYTRYHNDGNGALGFSFSWNGENGQVYGERLVTLISASLYAEATGGPWVTPPAYSQEVAATPPTTRPLPPLRLRSRTKRKSCPPGPATLSRVLVMS